jgi:hypothetical protein
MRIFPGRVCSRLIRGPEGFIAKIGRRFLSFILFAFLLASAIFHSPSSSALAPTSTALLMRASFSLEFALKFFDSTREANTAHKVLKARI